MKTKVLWNFARVTVTHCKTCYVCIGVMVVRSNAYFIGEYMCQPSLQSLDVTSQIPSNAFKRIYHCSLRHYDSLAICFISRKTNLSLSF